MKHNVSYRLRRDLAPYLTATYDALPDQLIRVGDVVMPRRIDVVLDEEFQPIVRFVLEVVDDLPVCTAVTVESREGGRALRHSDFERFDLDVLVRNIYMDAASWIRDRDDGVVEMGISPTEASRREVSEMIGAARKRGAPRKITDEFLRRVAEVYRENIDDRPTERVAAYFNVAPRTASMYLTKAREAGHLPPTTRGRKKA